HVSAPRRPIEAGGEAGDETLEHAIAGFGAEPLVEQAEAVDVDQRDGERPLGGERALEQLVELDAVRQAGRDVDQLAAADVAVRADDAAAALAAILAGRRRGGAAGTHPAIVAVAVTHAVLEVE